MMLLKLALLLGVLHRLVLLRMLLLLKHLLVLLGRQLLLQVWALRALTDHLQTDEKGPSANLNPFQAQALVELAKQRYRDLLRADPGDWDARYNLERALWLAPEAQDVFGAETDDMPKELLRIKVPGLPPGDLP